MPADHKIHFHFRVPGLPASKTIADLQTAAPRTRVVPPRIARPARLRSPRSTPRHPPSQARISGSLTRHPEIAVLPTWRAPRNTKGLRPARSRHSEKNRYARRFIQGWILADHEPKTIGFRQTRLGRPLAGVAWKNASLSSQRRVGHVHPRGGGIRKRCQYSALRQCKDPYMVLLAYSLPRAPVKPVFIQDYRTDPNSNCRWYRSIAWPR
jgi:hypothetical protein